MVRRLAFVALMLAPAAAAQGPRPVHEWTPVGITAAKPDPDDERQLPRPDPAGSTTLTLQLRLPGQVIIAVDPAECVLDRFADDRNTNLMAAAPARPNPTRVTAGAAPLHGKSIRVTFQGTGHPAAGATKLRVTGAVAVLVGRGEKSVERKDVSVRAGVDLDVGTIKAITGINKEVISSGVKYTGTRPLKKVVFLDRTGEEVEVPRNPFSAARPVGLKGEFTMLYTWPRTAPDPCTVRVTYFDRVETVLVPLDLEAGLGL